MLLQMMMILNCFNNNNNNKKLSCLRIYRQWGFLTQSLEVTKKKPVLCSKFMHNLSAKCRIKIMTWILMIQMGFCIIIKKQQQQRINCHQFYFLRSVLYGGLYYGQYHLAAC